MKKFLLIFFLFISFGIKAQFYLKADFITGCKPLQVHFSIQPDSLRYKITSYEWIFGNWTAIRTDSMPSVEFNLPGTFDVLCTIWMDDTFQQVQKSVYDTLSTLSIVVFNCDSILNIPNVFSPNEDNLNDFFSIDTDGKSVYTFSIYTPSGSLIYKSESPAVFWDGYSMSGYKMKPGIYYYTISRKDNVYLNEIKGFVYLFD